MTDLRGVEDRVSGARPPKVLFVVTEDWYFLSHRLPLARAAGDAGYQVVVATRAGRDAESIRREGFRLEALAMRRGRGSLWREVAAVGELWRLYRRERPDIIHLVAMKPVLLGGLAASFTRVPAIVNAIAGLGYVFASDRGHAGMLRPLVTIGLRLLLRGRRCWTIVQNPDDYRVLGRLGIAEDRIKLIAGSGVDTVRFAPSPEPPGPVTVALVSRMLWDKGVAELVEASRILRQSASAVRIELVGGPDPENPASIPESRLRQWHEAGLVSWRGPTSDVPAVWARCHIAVLPSYREGLPKALLEAAACGRPLITTDVPGCREVVVDGVTGLLVAPRDPEALAEAIRRLAQDADLRRRLGQAGRAWVEREFSQQRVVAETLALYRAARAAA